jgi:UDP-N-acetylglucosamine 1-carboxyvinyltransferase
MNIPFEKFLVQGKKTLKGSVQISGSKNAALPILSATLAVKGISSIENLPNISDVQYFLDILRAQGVKINQSGKQTHIDASNLFSETALSHPYIQKMRASILLLAPLLIRFGEVKIPFPGGCVLGKRSLETHLRAFRAFGAEILECKEYLHLRLPKGHFSPASIVLSEISVTATENAIIAAAFAKGVSEIRLAASEPHVQNLCNFFVSAGIHIEGIGTHTLRIHGGEVLRSPSVQIVSDYLESGTFILAGAITNSHIRIENVIVRHLDSFLEKLQETGVKLKIDEQAGVVETLLREEPLVSTNIQTGVFPKFPTDLHPQFGVLLTQCQGESKIFETLFERKFAYLLELEKMGAQVEIRNPHEFVISGATPLIGAVVASQDIRAGAAMLLAALTAEGETEIANVQYIDRGYNAIEEKLLAIGADIRRKRE